MSKRTQIFISYSHADSKHLLRLKTHLRPFERQGLIELWADTKIKPGQDWRKEIRGAISRASVAILLVSADFLASDFIAENELPPLLASAEKDGVKIISVILKTCAFAETPGLARFQAINSPDKPLIAMHAAHREGLWHRLAKEVSGALPPGAGGAAEDGAGTVANPLDESSPDWFRLEMISSELRSPSVLQGYFVYSYQHVDCLEYMPLASEVLSRAPNKDAVLDAVKARLRERGWEGDGEVRLMWLPPFLGAGVEDTWGLALWFVKQSNNGTAWIASPVPLPFQRLLEQQR